MSFRDKFLLVAASAGLIAALSAPATPSFARHGPAEPEDRPALAESGPPAPAAIPEPVLEPVAAPASTPAPHAARSDRDLVCLAKIVHHEAANQPRRGQIAVAQVVMNRLASPRFPKSVCAIALQPGQFFNVHAYHPERDPRWRTALEIAQSAMSGETPRLVGDALFFHSGSSSRFFHAREAVVRIGGHVFYR